MAEEEVEAKTCDILNCTDFGLRKNWLTKVCRLYNKWWIKARRLDLSAPKSSPGNKSFQTYEPLSVSQILLGHKESPHCINRD
jgi:hypothetical protein